MVTTLRRVAFPLRLAAVRLSHRRGRTALLAAGIAAGSAVLAVVIGGSLVAQDEQASRALARVPAAQRTVTAVYSDLGVSRKGATLQSTEPLVRGAPAPIQLFDFAAHAAELGHGAHRGYSSLLAEDVAVLDHVEGAHLGWTAQRRAGARRRDDLGQVANEELRHACDTLEGGRGDYCSPEG